MTIETIVATALHTADCDQRMAEADAQFVAEFVSLKGEAQAARWRGLDHGAKFRLIVRRIEQLGMSWEPSVVEAQIAKYDERFAAGPVELAIEGALERLARESSQAAVQAESKDDRAYFRRAATAYANALIEYRRGVRPDVLSSRAQLLPSRRLGEAPHLVTLDGDWVCSCKAGASMHWPIALVIGIEQAFEDMQQYDDGDGAGVCAGCGYEFNEIGEHHDETTAGPLCGECVYERTHADPPGDDNPLGPDEGDSVPSARALGARLCAARSLVWGFA